jgi:hypothetical protein
MNALQLSEDAKVIERYIIEYKHTNNNSSLLIILILAAFLMYLEYFVKKNKNISISEPIIVESLDKNEFVIPKPNIVETLAKDEVLYKEVELLHSKIVKNEEETNTKNSDIIKEIKTINSKIVKNEEETNTKNSDIIKEIKTINSKILKINDEINNDEISKKISTLESKITQLLLVNDKISEMTIKEENVYQTFIGTSEIHQEGCFRYKLDATIIKKKCNSYKENKDWLLENLDEINTSMINKWVMYLTNSNDWFWSEPRNIDNSLIGKLNQHNPHGWWNDDNNHDNLDKTKGYQMQSKLTCKKYDWDCIYEIKLIKTKIYAHTNYNNDNEYKNKIAECANTINWKKTLTTN